MASFLACWMLLASSGASMGMHFCGGELQDLALFGHAEGCAMHQPAEPVATCHSPAPNRAAPADISAETCAHGLAIEAATCCTDKLQTVPPVEQGSAPAPGPELPPAPALLAVVQVLFGQLFEPLQPEKPLFSLYEPPPLAHQNIPVLVQCFRL